MKGLYWIVSAVSLGGLLFGFDTGVISGCEEAIQREFSLSPFWHGLVVAGALFGTVFGALAAGRLCDRFGRKPLLVSGCAAMAAMHALVAWQVSLGEACTPWIAMAGVYGFIAAVDDALPILRRAQKESKSFGSGHSGASYGLAAAPPSKNTP